MAEEPSHVSNSSGSPYSSSSSLPSPNHFVIDDAIENYALEVASNGNNNISGGNSNGVHERGRRF